MEVVSFPYFRFIFLKGLEQEGCISTSMGHPQIGLPLQLKQLLPRKEMGWQRGTIFARGTWILGYPDTHKSPVLAWRHFLEEGRRSSRESASR